MSEVRAIPVLDPAVLSRIANLELVARSVVEGFLSGLHRAPHLGVSLDFAEHRAYMPGDDIRRIDWKLYARTDRFYLKQFEADTNTDVVALVDASRSMGFGVTGATKLDYAKMLAASLLFFSNRQRDRVGLVTFDEQVREFVPASAKHLQTALHSLDRLATAGGNGPLEKPIATAANSMRKKGIRILISDFYEDPAGVAKAIDLLRAGGSDVIMFHVLDRAERELPVDDAASFRDLETGDQIPVVPWQFRERYRSLIAAHIDALQQIARERRVDYTLLETTTPLDQALFAYLSHRQYTLRVRA
ncbi:MAG TPA: DUF58 domain-containing protein [Gemmatimonadaceae bacterium]|nr:DUF58 domain-containing protein [Gemmatimonadaceae bacterium]